jgi:hypothetical protein
LLLPLLLAFFFNKRVRECDTALAPPPPPPHAAAAAGGGGATPTFSHVHPESQSQRKRKRRVAGSQRMYHRCIQLNAWFKTCVCTTINTCLLVHAQYLLRLSRKIWNIPILSSKDKIKSNAPKIKTNTNHKYQ